MSMRVKHASLEMQVNEASTDLLAAPLVSVPLQSIHSTSTVVSNRFAAPFQSANSVSTALVPLSRSTC
jgi:hypothetical protein